MVAREHAEIERALRGVLDLSDDHAPEASLDQAVRTGLAVVLSDQIQGMDATTTATAACERASDAVDAALRTDAAFCDNIARCRAAFDEGRRDALLVILLVWHLTPACCRRAFTAWSRTVAEANRCAARLDALHESGAFCQVTRHDRVP